MFETGVIVILWFIYTALRDNNPIAVREREERHARRVAEEHEKFKRESIAWRLDYEAAKRVDLVRAGRR